jgi:hypothetical protein
LTQGFFLHLLEQRALAGVDRLKGKFRSFLLASFQNHLSDQFDRSRRLKKGEEAKNSLGWTQKRPKNAIAWSRSTL